jgi:DNA-binding winged helix-turn-helix (wHTH) protein
MSDILTSFAQFDQEHLSSYQVPEQAKQKAVTKRPKKKIKVKQPKPIPEDDLDIPCELPEEDLDLVIPDELNEDLDDDYQFEVETVLKAGYDDIIQIEKDALEELRNDLETNAKSFKDTQQHFNMFKKQNKPHQANICINMMKTLKQSIIRIRQLIKDSEDVIETLEKMNERL